MNSAKMRTIPMWKVNKNMCLLTARLIRGCQNATNCQDLPKLNWPRSSEGSLLLITGRLRVTAVGQKRCKNCQDRHYWIARVSGWTSMRLHLLDGHVLRNSSRSRKTCTGWVYGFASDSLLESCYSDWLFEPARKFAGGIFDNLEIGTW